MKFAGVIAILGYSIASLIVGSGGTATINIYSESTTPNPREICGGVNKGIQLCTEDSVEAEADGGVPLNIIIKNVGEEKITLTPNGFFNDYQISVTDLDGKDLRSRQEIFDDRVQRGEVSQQEFIQSLPINNRGKPILLDPNNQSSLIYSLDILYPFTTPGIYKIDLARRLGSGDLVWLPTVHVKIIPKGKK